MKKKKIKKEIKLAIKDSLQNFFRGKEVKVVHPLDLIFPKERRIRSLIGGLETSLGTRVWEPIAKTLAKNNGYTVLDEKEFNTQGIGVANIVTGGDRDTGKVPFTIRDSSANGWD